VFQVAQKRADSSDATRVILTLDQEYTPAHLYVEDGTRFGEDGTSVEDAGVARANWNTYWEFRRVERDLEQCRRVAGACSAARISQLENELTNLTEDSPERRFYWVFPPPVEAERAGPGVPVFDGAHPVLGVEVRQVTISPEFALADDRP
jgi:hypothetical protein